MQPTELNRQITVSNRASRSSVRMSAPTSVAPTPLPALGCGSARPSRSSRPSSTCSPRRASSRRRARRRRRRKAAVTALWSDVAWEGATARSVPGRSSTAVSTALPSCCQQSGRGWLPPWRSWRPAPGGQAGGRQGDDGGHAGGRGVRTLRCDLSGPDVGRGPAARERRPAVPAPPASDPRRLRRRGAVRHPGGEHPAGEPRPSARRASHAHPVQLPPPERHGGEPAQGVHAGRDRHPGRGSHARGGRPVPDRAEGAPAPSRRAAGEGEPQELDRPG